MIMIFIVWAIYVLLGLLWLNFLVNKDWVNEWNQLGAIFLVCIWPIHIVYYLSKRLFL